ncbi:MAG: DUF2892 domain-containing protein [Armatimonadetes bacterium]|nr:DUF2892 domain-containing protein [Armatimonadota bacterium]
MTIERSIRLLAGLLSLTGILLSIAVDHRWLFLSGFVAVNLIQSSFTGFCPAEKIMLKLGVGRR